MPQRRLRHKKRPDKICYGYVFMGQCPSPLYCRYLHDLSGILSPEGLPKRHPSIPSISSGASSEVRMLGFEGHLAPTQNGDDIVGLLSTSSPSVSPMLRKTSLCWHYGASNGVWCLVGDYCNYTHDFSIRAPSLATIAIERARELPELPQTVIMSPSFFDDDEDDKRYEPWTGERTVGDDTFNSYMHCWACCMRTLCPYYHPREVLPFYKYTPCPLWPACTEPDRSYKHPCDTLECLPQGMLQFREFNHHPDTIHHHDFGPSPGQEVSPALSPLSFLLQVDQSDSSSDNVQQSVPESSKDVDIDSSIHIAHQDLYQASTPGMVSPDTGADIMRPSSTVSLGGFSRGDEGPHWDGLILEDIAPRCASALGSFPGWGGCERN